MREVLQADAPHGKAEGLPLSPAEDLRDVLELVSLDRARGPLERGVVGRCSPPDAGPARYEIQLDDGRLIAQQAESCVLRPEVGDVVLVSIASSQPTYILAVLQRSSDAPRVWQAPGAAPVTVSAERLGLEGKQAASVRAPVLDVVAPKATLAFQAATVTSDVLRGASGTLEWMSRKLQSVADWSVHQAGTYVRSVAGADTVVAEHIVRTAHQTMTSTSKHELRDAKEDVHISAKRIHMR